MVLLLCSQKYQGYNVKHHTSFKFYQPNLMQLAEPPKLPLDDEDQTGCSQADLPPPGACRDLQLSHICNSDWEGPGLPISGAHCFSNHQGAEVPTWSYLTTLGLMLHMGAEGKGQVGLARLTFKKKVLKIRNPLPSRLLTGSHKDN